MNYILIETEYCNGLPYHNFEAFDSYDDAREKYDTLCQEAMDEYPDGYEEEYWGKANFIDSFSISDDRPTGNGYFHAIIKEDDMVSDIMSAVDNSKDTFLLQHIDSIMPYEMECKAINFNSGESHTVKDEDENFTENVEDFTLQKIVKRPYDIDNPQDPDNIYDVYIKAYPDWMNRDEHFIYCDSLEVIGISAVVATFCEIFIQ